MTTTVGVSALGTAPLAGLWARANPTVTLTAPTGTIGATGNTLSFTYSSPVSRTQYSYRYQIRSEDGTSVLYDSYAVVSTATSGISIPYTFADGSSYQIWVRAADRFDTSEWSTGTVSVEASDLASYPDEPRVGSVFEIGINGVGFMLADRPDRPVQRRTTILQPDRFATSDTPFSEAVERYSFLGFMTPTEGAGQEFYGRRDSSPYRFRRSAGVNPFQDDAVQLWNDTTVTTSNGRSTGVGALVAVAGGDLYTLSSSGLIAQSTIGGSETSFSIAAAGTIVDLTSDGDAWYVCDGANVFRGTAASDPGSAWSTIDADLIEWTVDRLTGVYDNGAGQLCVTTFDTAGAEEVAGGRFKYPDTVSIPSVTAGDGYVWWVVNRTTGSQVHYWQLGASDTYAANALSFPAGQRCTSLGFYLGNVFAHTVEPVEEGAGFRHIIYRCVPQNGTLIPDRVCDWTDEAATVESCPFTGDDRFVQFGWANMTTVSGCGTVDLSTGGWATGLQFTGNTAEIVSAALWDGVPVFGTSDGKVFVEDVSTVVDTGWLETSVWDLQSGLSKVFDRVEAAFDPVPTGAGMSVEYTTDGGISYTSAGASVSTAGLTGSSWELKKSARSIGLKVTLTASSVDSLKVRFLQTKLHPLTISDQLLVLPVNCANELAGLNGQIIRDGMTGIGRARWLEQLVGSRIKLQDVDWADTGVSTTWEVVDVETVLTGVKDPRLGRRVDSGVSQITLRREQ
jgi:hypothetical protein